MRAARRGLLVHLTGDQPGIRTQRTGVGVARHSEPSCTTRKTSRRDSRSGRCSAATAASTSPPNTPSTPKPCGSPNSTNPSPPSSRATGRASRTSATSPPSTGTRSSPWTSSSAASPAKTYPPSANAQASRPAPAPACGRTWPKPSTHSNPNGSSSRTSEGCCPPQRRDQPQKETGIDSRNPGDATPDGAAVRELEPDPWHLGDNAARPLRAHGAVLGDLADLRLDARWIGLPASLVGAPHHRLRIFILAHRTLPHPTRDRLLTRRRDPRPGTGKARDDRALAPDHRLRSPRTAWLTDQEARVGDAVVPDRRTVQRWGRYADAIARWEHITGRPAPAPALLNDADGPRPAPAFVEWLMGLPTG